MVKYAVAHSLLIIASASLVLAQQPIRIKRQGGGGGGGSVVVGQPTVSSPSAPAASPSSTTALPASTASSSATPPPFSSSSASTTPTSTSASQSSSSAASSSASASSAPSSDSASQSSSASPTSAPQDTSISFTSTDAEGQPTVVVTVSPVSESSTASPSPTSSKSSGDNSISQGTIIGLSVAGGIAAFAIIGFIIWKLTRKRFSDLDDPDEAIKWPELNRDSHLDSGNNGLSRQLSSAYSTAAPSRNASALDHSEYADPYAVPPLPQFNPNQPYRDDPYAASGGAYYDPYRGPIPQTFHDGSVDGHESIPMSTYPPGARSRSPGPGAAYDGRGSPAPGGRASPGPGAAYDMSGRGSPAPGRTISPGPAAALGLDRRPSPGPQYALGGPPEMVARNKSPGPNALG